MSVLAWQGVMVQMQHDAVIFSPFCQEFITAARSIYAGYMRMYGLIKASAALQARLLKDMQFLLMLASLCK